MGDQSGLPTGESSPDCKAKPAELSGPSLTPASDSHPPGQAPSVPQRTQLDYSSFLYRLRDNLNWANTFAPIDFWREIQDLLTKPDKEFVTGLYEVLLGRPPEPSALAASCVALAGDASRVSLVRTIARSEEAAASQLDVSWLSHLDEVESDAVWRKVQSLWDEPNHVFVANLYPLLLLRPSTPEEVITHCRAMKAGTSRAGVVRAFALSDEARTRGLRFSWLPRLELLPLPPQPSPLLSLHRLKTAYRRWRNGKTNASPVSPLKTQGPPQLVEAAAEGGR